MIELIASNGYYISAIIAVLVLVIIGISATVQKMNRNSQTWFAITVACFSMVVLIAGAQQGQSQKDDLLEIFAIELEEHFDAEGYEAVENYCEEMGTFEDMMGTYISCELSIHGSGADIRKKVLKLVVREYQNPGDSAASKGARWVARDLDESQLPGLKDWDDRTKYHNVD